MVSLRNRFGIPGVISVIALVFAMFGGAYAASNSSGGGKATASAKAKKGPRGPKGATGPAGPAGAVGPAGPGGARGDTGAAGSNGANGAPGAPGQSVTSSVALPEPAHCEEGGSKFTIGSKTTYACNGEPGGTGPAGSPWTLGGTLPVDATETGAWSARANGPRTYEGVEIPSDAAPLVPISFPVHLAATLDETHVHYVTSPGGHCTGSVAEPTADSGHLCVYQGASNSLGVAPGEEIANPEFTALGAGVSGALVNLRQPDAGVSSAYISGSWAVTG